MATTAGISKWTNEIADRPRDQPSTEDEDRDQTTHEGTERQTNFLVPLRYANLELTDARRLGLL